MTRSRRLRMCPHLWRGRERDCVIPAAVRARSTRAAPPSIALAAIRFRFHAFTGAPICGLRLSMDSWVNDGSSTPSGSADTEPEGAEGVRLATEDDRNRRWDRVSFRSFPLHVVI
jgi:hypothetical protein